jgi:hypothetical protein
MDAFFTAGSVHDSQLISEITKELEGLFVGDKEEVFWELYERHWPIMSAIRKNMKRGMTGEQNTGVPRSSLFDPASA